MEHPPSSVFPPSHALQQSVDCSLAASRPELHMMKSPGPPPPASPERSPALSRKHRSSASGKALTHQSRHPAELPQTARHQPGPWPSAQHDPVPSLPSAAHMRLTPCSKYSATVPADRFCRASQELSPTHDLCRSDLRSQTCRAP